ncbi:hypothetical protein [Amycolatopsis sp. H20-H5]|uniref:hypothetical protein n=1 Tax=Amycolatopsis sp. H20-H5 TaxID=3046309 RepID=UPI002DC0137F|nr:hypothetical protein [Amycolatopsis sp. H20-H5]MEC3981502.1 hypothetical protein [Amycolatopsis sp. H20-H5]
MPIDTPAAAEDPRADEQPAQQESRLARAADEVEVAAWETVYEVEDLAHQVVEKVKNLGHRHEKPAGETPAP